MASNDSGTVFKIVMTCDGLLNNTSVLDRGDNGNITGDKQLYNTVYQIFYGYGLPTVCAFGFLGNVLNLIILAGKRVQRSLRRMEQSANIGLLSLAVADMCFCISAFPSTFLPEDMKFSNKGFLFYYGFYCHAVINIFIMTSTWLTVTMATERYLAICHPLKSRNVISLQRTKIVIICVYVISAIFNFPVFWKNTFTQKSCFNKTTYTIIPQVLDEKFDHAYRASWAVFGNFIPLLLLLVFNIGLMREVHKSYAMRRKMKGGGDSKIHHSGGDAEANNRITITLVSIVVMFFVLVAPSELLKHVAFLFGSDLSRNYTYLTIEIITNVMQTINFSANFILYCIINPSFRKTMKELFCFQYKKLKFADQYETNYSQFPMHDRCSSVRASTNSFRGNGANQKSVSMPIRSLR